MIRIALIALCLAAAPFAFAAPGAWIPLFDGTSLDGWRVAENPDSIRVEDGVIVCDGPRAHLFYDGPVEDAEFKNFIFELEYKTRPGANSGVFFHTEFQDEGWPDKGYEAQINHSQARHGNYYEWRKTGSLYGVRNQYLSVAPDNQWNRMRITVAGKMIVIEINDVVTASYIEPEEPIRSGRRVGRVLSEGAFALQCHDPGSYAQFRNIRVRPLPDELGAALSLPEPDDATRLLTELSLAGFPLIDFHIHLKGGLQLHEALSLSLQHGISYGIAVNCGLGFPVQTDEDALAFLDSLKGKACFTAMQAEGREWVNMFSPETIAQFDYVFSDALTWTDDKGRRMRLWMEDEVFIDDADQFMDMYVDRIVGVISTEPIDIFVNPTFLPERIAADYNELWTPERMQRVIDAAVKHKVAIEINARYEIPGAAFIRRAKRSGATFAFGTNNGEAELGRMEYCLKMIDECGITGDDMFYPRPHDQKPILVKGFEKTP